MKKNDIVIYIEIILEVYMKNISIDTSLLKQLVMGLIIREFGSIEVFNQEFELISPRLKDIPRTGNPIITIKQFTSI